MSVAIRYAGAGTRALITSGNEPEWCVKHKRRGYVRQAYLSVPPWMDRAELRWFDWCRRAWSAATGTEQVLSHIVPLNHPHVCGLTVPWNLQLTTRAVNAYAGNDWHPDQLELI